MSLPGSLVCLALRAEEPAASRRDIHLVSNPAGTSTRCRLWEPVGLGIRVPGLLISPYAKQGYIDHQTYTLASWLHLVEARFGLPALTGRDAAATPMLDGFDFGQRPRAPVVLAPDGSPYPHSQQEISR